MIQILWSQSIRMIVWTLAAHRKSPAQQVSTRNIVTRQLQLHHRQAHFVIHLVIRKEEELCCCNSDAIPSRSSCLLPPAKNDGLFLCQWMALISFVPQNLMVSELVMRCSSHSVFNKLTILRYTEAEWTFCILCTLQN